MEGRTVWMWVRAWVRMRGCVKVAWFVGKAYEAPVGKEAGVEFK